MKLKRKTLMMIGSIVGVTTIGATVTSTMLTSCSETAISNEQIELDDDYELNQAKFDFNEFYTMLISNDNNDYIVNERNGVTRDQITKVNEIQIFFDKLETVINTGLTNTKTTFHWYDYEPADLIQATLQLFRFAVLPIFDWFINDTFFMKFLLTDQQRADTTQWFIDMLDGKILIKEWAKNALALRATIFQGLIKPLLCDWIKGEKVELWDWISLFYGNPWYLGIDCEHYGDGNPLDSSYIDLKALPGFIAPTYTKYDYAQVEEGDILYSANGFAIGDVNTGHMGIITGWKTDINGIRYLQCIEPDQYGVHYCAIDDKRIDQDALSIIHIQNSTELQRIQAVAFAESQIGKDYYLPLFMTMSTDINTPTWYCSELVWASYKSIGLDIQNHNYLETIGCEPGATPHNIYNYEYAQVLIENQAGCI